MNGSPETLVESGVDAGARELERWVDQVVKAVDGKDSEAAIKAALNRIEDQLPLERFAELAEQQLLHGVMLGALDSLWEREHEEEIPLPAFTASKVLFKRDRGPFASTPYAEAVRLFESRTILPKEQFDALRAGAKRRAFTVAGLARQELLQTAHGELARQVRQSGERTYKDPTTDKWVYKGPNFREFKKHVRTRLESAGWTPANRSHVETIFRTNVGSAYSSGRFAEMTQPAVLAARPYWQVQTVRDDRQRETHRAANGIILPADHPFWRDAYPPFGYNCFLPGTEITGQVCGASKAWYAGEAVELTTAVGRRLTVTANHPVLTVQGFTTAQSLVQGEHLVCHVAETRVGALGPGAETDDQQAPTRVEQVFRTLAEAGSGSFTGYRGEEFHGEARCFEGEVHVVGSYWRLLQHHQAAVADVTSQLVLEESEPSLPPGVGAGSLSSLEDGDVAPARLGPGGRALPLDGGLVSLDAAPLQTLRLGTASQFDAVLLKDATEGRPADAALARELLQRYPSQVALDQVVSVRKFEFRGHVYDVESPLGWIVANGVVSSNCRCRVISRSKRWVDKTGATIGPAPTELPDPGFDSGTTGLIGGGDVAIPSTPPAPAGGGQPPPAAPPGGGGSAPPRPPPVPTPPRPRPGMPEQGRHFARIQGKLRRKREHDAVMSTFNEAGALRFLEESPLERLLFTKRVANNSRRVSNSMPHGCSGCWYPEVQLGNQTLRAQMKIRTGNVPFGRGALTADSPALFNVAEAAETELEAIRRSTFHEIGHEVHMRGRKLGAGGVDYAGSTEEWQQVDHAIQRAYIRREGSAAHRVSAYAEQDPAEYFAESFSLYHTDKAVLRARDAGAFDMVERVREIRRLGQ